MLQEWGAGGFLKNVEMTFKNYTYCTVSALGQQPVISQTGGAKELRTIPRPHRVEDPFLWILKENQSGPQADIYSLGVLINVMLTGEHSSRKLADGRLGRVVQRCTQVNPEKRYRSVIHLMEAIRL